MPNGKPPIHFGQKQQQVASQQQQSHAAEARRMFAQGLASGEVRALDRFTAPIVKGSLVLMLRPDDLIFTVTDVAPELNPRAPVGMIRLTLQLTMHVGAPANQVLRQLIVCGNVSEDGKQTELKSPDATPLRVRDEEETGTDQLPPPGDQDDGPQHD